MAMTGRKFRLEMQCVNPDNMEKTRLKGLTFRQKSVILALVFRRGMV